MQLAERLFAELSLKTRKGVGIERDSYGAGEQAAHDLMRASAEGLGLEVSVDAIGNLMMKQPGRDRQAPGILIGSHLDSVPQGGNYDGAAGVIAGLSVLAGMQRAGITPPCDVTVMAIRAEESAWFDVSYAGSAGAFGLLDPSCLAVRRSDTGRTLEETLRAYNFDPEAIRERRRLLDPKRIRAYLELHIEQGPTLVERGLPAGVVTAIRGCKRFRNARCLGRYGHSGATERAYRQDAVAATVALLHHLESVWIAKEKAGADLVFTSGELYTDAAMHAPSKVSGETHFVLDIRSVSNSTMNEMGEEAGAAARRFGAEYRVQFELGDASDSPPALMDQRLRGALMKLLEQPFELASGAGHDAATFAEVGIPSGMIFVRNDHGSHNSDESMEIEDFAVGARAMQQLILDFPF
ncbi:MAG TPA: hydantoinase/carbamoylase family amidase [Steroidobacteraceae bacterium]|jgi:N-carbamoyl-L-amino-acid hydrolase